MSGQSKKARWIVLAALIAAGLIVGAVLYFVRSPQPITRTAGASSEVADAQGFGDTVLYEGENYRLNRNLKTVLFLGIDEGDTIPKQDEALPMGRSDTMLLFVLDPNAKTTRILEIPRDTMVTVDTYDAQNNVILSSTMQITMQYAFGSSRKRSNWLTSGKVSELLYGVPMDATVSFSMDGIAPVIDALGGVTITMEPGDEAADPAWKSGTEVRLSGAEAERFARYRDTTVTGSNITRMGRQMRLLQALYHQLESSNDLAGGISTLQQASEPYLESDLDAQTLQQLSQSEIEQNVEILPGETRAGEYHDEYYADEDALRKLVIEWFYQPVT